MIGTHLHTREAEASILSSLDSKAAASATSSDQSATVAPEDFASMLWSLIAPDTRKSSDADSDSSSETQPVSQNDDRFSNQHADSTSDYMDVSPFSKKDSKDSYLPFARTGTNDTTTSTYKGFGFRAGAGSFEPETSQPVVYQAATPLEAGSPIALSKQLVGTESAKDTAGTSYETGISGQPLNNAAITTDIVSPRTTAFAASTIVERTYNPQGSGSSNIAPQATASPTSSTNSHDLHSSWPSYSSPKTQTITNTSPTSINSDNIGTTSETRSDNLGSGELNELFAPVKPAFNDAGPRAIVGRKENSTSSSTRGTSPDEVAPETDPENTVTSLTGAFTAAKNPTSTQMHGSTDLVLANEASAAAISSKIGSPESGNYLEASAPTVVAPFSSKIASRSESADSDRHPFIGMDSSPTPIAHGKSVEWHSQASSAAANSQWKGTAAKDLLNSQPQVSVGGDSNRAAVGQSRSTERQIQSSAVSGSNLKGSLRTGLVKSEDQASTPLSGNSRSSTTTQSEKSTQHIPEMPVDRALTQGTQVQPLGASSSRVMLDRSPVSANIAPANDRNSVLVRTKAGPSQSSAPVGGFEPIGKANRTEVLEVTSTRANLKLPASTAVPNLSTKVARNNNGVVSPTRRTSTAASLESTPAASTIPPDRSTTAPGDTLSEKTVRVRQVKNDTSLNSFALDRFAAVLGSSSQSSHLSAVTNPGSTNADDTHTDTHTQQSSAQPQGNPTVTGIAIDDSAEASVARTVATGSRMDESATDRIPMASSQQSAAGQQLARANVSAGSDASVPSAKHAAASPASRAFVYGDDKPARYTLPPQGTVDRSSGSADTRTISTSADDRPLPVTSEGGGKEKATSLNAKTDSYTADPPGTATQSRVSGTPNTVENKSSTTPSSASIRLTAPLAPSPSGELRQPTPSQKPLPVLPSVDGAQSADTSPRGGVELQITKPGQVPVSPAESGRAANLTVQLSDGQTARAIIRERDGAVDVKIVTSNSATAERVSGEIDSMRQNFDAAGLRLGHSEVSYQNGRGDSGRGREQYQRQSQAEQSSNEVFTLSEVVE
jgi:hypothetical protein